MLNETPQPAIAVEALTKRYKTVTAVDGISFRIEPNSITGLLGGNGAGKTTTIGMILGLILPTAGRMQVLGHAPSPLADTVPPRGYRSTRQTVE